MQKNYNELAFTLLHNLGLLKNRTLIDFLSQQENGNRERDLRCVGLCF